MFIKNEDGEIVGIKVFQAVGAAIALILFLVLFFGSFTTIGVGERGVLVTMGKVEDKVLIEGFHLKLPIVQSVETIDVRTKKEEEKADAASKDLQAINATIAINYHVDPLKANALFQLVGQSYSERIIAPAIQESIKAVVAKFTAEELITRRAEVKDATKLLLAKRLGQNNIILDEFSITNFAFSQQFDKAIESKQTAVQEALKAKNDLERVKMEAQQKIEQARAEAERIKIQAESISKQGGAEYVNLKAVEKWDGKLPQQMIPGSTLPFINLNK